MANTKINNNELKRLRRDFEKEAGKYHDLTLSIHFIIRDFPQKPIEAKDPHHGIPLWQYMGNLASEEDVKRFSDFQQTDFGHTGAEVTAVAVIEGKKTKLFRQMAQRAGSLLEPINYLITKLIMDNFADPTRAGKPVFAGNPNPLALWLNMTLMCVATFQPGRFKNQTLAVDPFTASLAVFDYFFNEIEKLDSVPNDSAQNKENMNSEINEKQEIKGFIDISKRRRFNWDNLQKLWLDEFGGSFTKATKTKESLNFVWEDPNVEKLVRAGEEGKLDEQVKSFGGNVVTEILNSHSECLYQFVSTIDFINAVQIESVDKTTMQKASSNIDVLFLTVTEAERDAVLARMKPLPGQTSILEGSITDTTYRFGQFGNYRCAHVESTMGAQGRHGATLKSRAAIEELKPKAFLILGIAFGVDRKKQRLGDVIVAETIQPYAYERIGKDRVIPRGIEMQCGMDLSERFRTRRRGWKVRCGKREVKVFQGQMLSGPKLVDNREFRDDLIDKYPNAKGGEMEGEGGYAAAEQARVQTILVKSICDWADGHKNDNAHSFAAFTAVSLVEHVLSQPDVLAVISAKDIKVFESNNNVQNFLDFTRIQFCSELWIEKSEPKNSDTPVYPFDIICSKYLYLDSFVKHQNPLFDVIIRNTASKPLIILSIGIKIELTADVTYYYSSGASPKHFRILADDAIKLPMPRLKNFWGSHSETYPPRKEDIKVESPNEEVELKLFDPIFLDIDGPYRFKLELEKYINSIPNNMVMRIMINTDLGKVYSEPIYLFTF